jgi:hypothetical protein
MDNRKSLSAGKFMITTDFCYTRATKTCFRQKEAGYGFSYIGNEGFLDNIIAEQVLLPVCSSIIISENNERLFAVLPTKNGQYLSVFSAAASTDGHRKTPFVHGYIFDKEAKESLIKNRAGNFSPEKPALPYLTNIFSKSSYKNVYFGDPESAAAYKEENKIEVPTEKDVKEAAISQIFGVEKKPTFDEIGIDELTFKKITVALQACVRKAQSQVFFIVPDRERVFEVGRKLAALLFMVMPPEEARNLGVVISDTESFADSQTVKAGGLVYNVPTGDRPFIPGANLYILTSQPIENPTNSTFFNPVKDNFPKNDNAVNKYVLFEQKMLPAITGDASKIKALEDYYNIFTEKEDDFRKCGCGAPNYDNISFLLLISTRDYLEKETSLRLSKLIRLFNFAINCDADLGFDAKKLFGLFLSMQKNLSPNLFENQKSFLDQDIVTLFTLAKICNRPDGLSTNYFLKNGKFSPLFITIVRRTEPESKLIKEIKKIGETDEITVKKDGTEEKVNLFSSFHNAVEEYYNNNKKKVNDAELLSKSLYILLTYDCEGFSKKDFIKSEFEYICEYLPDNAIPAFLTYIDYTEDDTVITMMEQILSISNYNLLKNFPEKLKKKKLLTDIYKTRIGENFDKKINANKRLLKFAQEDNLDYEGSEELIPFYFDFIIWYYRDSAPETFKQLSEIILRLFSLYSRLSEDDQNKSKSSVLYRIFIKTLCAFHDENGKYLTAYDNFYELFPPDLYNAVVDDLSAMLPGGKIIRDLGIETDDSIRFCAAMTSIAASTDTLTIAAFMTNLKRYIDFYNIIRNGAAKFPLCNLNFFTVNDFRYAFIEKLYPLSAAAERTDLTAIRDFLYAKTGSGDLLYKTVELYIKYPYFTNPSRMDFSDFIHNFKTIYNELRKNEDGFKIIEHIFLTDRFNPPATDPETERLYYIEYIIYNTFEYFKTAENRDENCKKLLEHIRYAAERVAFTSDELKELCDGFTDSAPFISGNMQTSAANHVNGILKEVDNYKNYPQHEVVYSETPAEYDETPAAYDDNRVIYSESPAGYNDNPVIYSESPAAYDDNPVIYSETPAAYVDNRVIYSETPAAYDETPDKNYYYEPEAPDNPTDFLPTIYLYHTEFLSEDIFKTLYNLKQLQSFNKVSYGYNFVYTNLHINRKVNVVCFDGLDRDEIRMFTERETGSDFAHVIFTRDSDSFAEPRIMSDAVYLNINLTKYDNYVRTEKPARFRGGGLKIYRWDIPISEIPKPDSALLKILKETSYLLF